MSFWFKTYMQVQGLVLHGKFIISKKGEFYLNISSDLEKSVETKPNVEKLLVTIDTNCS